MSESGDGQKSAGARGGTSPLEWVVAGVSALVVLGTAGFLVREATGPSSPPLITVQVDTVVRAGQGWLVEFQARNSGHSTAAGLVIEGELTSDTGAVEKSEMIIDYVPARGKRQGGLFFSHDPRQNRLDIRPKGYERP